MSGTINIALTQQFDMDGEPLGGGLLYFFQAATTTPQTAFQDTALTIPWPNPIVLDASGRVPMFYLADGNIKIRLTDKSGVTVIAADNLLVIGPSTGGGGGGGVDATTVLQTGDIKARFGTGGLTGFVRCNGLTIGNSTSGAVERANADCQALFEYLWSTGVLQVFAGGTPSRGATANGDWVASKNIALPDLRGRSIAGMDDMGSTAANRLTASFFGAAANVLGNGGGSEMHQLTAAEMFPHTHSGSTGFVSSDHTHTWGGTFGTSPENAAHAHDFTTGTESANHVHGWGGTFGTSGADRSLDHTHSYNQPIPNRTGGTTGDVTSFGGATQTGGSSIGSLDHLHTVSVGGNTGTVSALHTHSGTTAAENAAHAHTVSVSGTTSGISANHNHGFTTDTGAGVAGASHAIASPAMVMTYYMKL